MGSGNSIIAVGGTFERNHRCYGYRRMQASLNKQSITMSEKVVRRLKKQERLVVVTPKRRRYGSYLGEISPAPDNLINRDFQAAAPNKKWLTDITEFQIPAGKIDGMVVSWSIGTRPDAELVNSMRMRPSRPLHPAANVLSYTPIAAHTIAGPDGSRASPMLG